jgi:protein gp37
MSKIQWTDLTVNPITVATGGHWCRKISAGCANCYAEVINTGNRFDFASGLSYTGAAPALKFDHAMVEKWSRMRSLKRIFVCSMTDLFGDWVSREWQFRVFDGAEYAPMQTIQILTKRPDIAFAAAQEWCEAARQETLPSNLWIGVTAENQQSANERIPVLLDTPAAVRFLSCEPLLEPINFDVPASILDGDEEVPSRTNLLTGLTQGLTPLHMGGIDWVIIGGESGPGARPCHVEWLRDIAAQCRSVGVTVFVKQSGSNCWLNGKRIKVQGSKKGGDEEWLASLGLLIREFPTL